MHKTRTSPQLSTFIQNTHQIYIYTLHYITKSLYIEQKVKKKKNAISFIMIMAFQGQKRKKGQFHIYIYKWNNIWKKNGKSFNSLTSDKNTTSHPGILYKKVIIALPERSLIFKYSSYSFTELVFSISIPKYIYIPTKLLYGRGKQYIYLLQTFHIHTYTHIDRK